MFDPWHYSRYLTRLFDSNKVSRDQLSASLHNTWTRFLLSDKLKQLTPSSNHCIDNLGIGLRRLRQVVYSHVMIRDLTGLADVQEVTQQMSLLAEFCIQQGIDLLYRELVKQHGLPVGQETQLPQELLVVAMGKLGGSELNVSSDIDLIFVYEEEGETSPQNSDQRTISNQDFFWKLSQQLNKLLSDITEEGFVFRVDLRLRPNGQSGPLVVNLAMLEDYFTIQGRDWERYAWIKARVVSDPQSPHVQRGTLALIKKVTPFVYRRHLDYSAMGALRAIHRLIREEATLSSIKQTYRGADIKLGSGGIREIEFIAQVFQLIHGGQDFRLRIIPTLSVLTVLNERQFLSTEETDLLKEAYIFLRKLEHRIQYREDQQIHFLPTQPDELNELSYSMGYTTSEQLLKALHHIQNAVSTLFNRIFPSTSDPDLNEGDRLWQRAEILLDDNLEQHPHFELLKKLGSLKNTFAYRAQTPRTREQFDLAMGKGLTKILTHPLKDEQPVAINRFLRFMESISRKAAYVMLLVEYPQVLTRLVDLLIASEWASLYITERPQLLDEFLKKNPFQHNLKNYWSYVREQLIERLDETNNDIEEQMHVLRRAKHQQTFQILLQDLQHQLTVTEIADHLSAMADMMAHIVLHQAWAYYPKKHRPDPLLAIIAYGKWGSKEMGYSSDLDLVFLHNDPHPDAQYHYSQIVRKFSQWMITPMGTGILYDIDMQLRPNGNAGLLVSPLDAFHDYHHQNRDNSAWVWEHQALTRARFCCGEESVGKAFQTIRFDVLTKERELPILKGEILSMRQRMHQGHPNNSALFDIKHDQGGMIDIEFIVQYLILAYAHHFNKLTENLGNIALLKYCGEIGLLDKQASETLAQHYFQYRDWQHKERLKGTPHARMSPDKAAPFRNDVIRIWNMIFQTD